MAPNCPRTGTPGRPVPAETVRALVPDLPPGGTDRLWHYCGAPDCEVVYFEAGGAVIEKSALAVRVGEKESDPPHTVCYCFGHTVESIREDLARHGRTTIPDSIKARVKAHECSCEVSNPKGSCCLGDVAREVARAGKELSATPGTAQKADPSPSSGSGETDTCCASGNLAQAGPTDARTDRRTLAALAVSGLTAIGASACCWLPLLLVAVGASSAGVAATFEGLRPILLVVAPVLIGISFYLIYLRRAPCSEGSACAVRRGSGGRTVRVSFWVAVALLGFSIAFPSAMSSMLGGTGPTHAERLASLPSLELRISGMTCESCSAGVRSALLDVDGVVDAAVDHKQGTARVWYEPAHRPPAESLRASVKRQGYDIEQIGEHAESPASARRVLSVRAGGMVKSLGIT